MGESRYTPEQVDEINRQARATIAEVDELLAERRDPGEFPFTPVRVSLKPPPEPPKPAMVRAGWTDAELAAYIRATAAEIARAELIEFAADDGDHGALVQDTAHLAEKSANAFEEMRADISTQGAMIDDLVARVGALENQIAALAADVGDAIDRSGASVVPIRKATP